MISKRPKKGTPEYAEFLEARVLDNLVKTMERQAKIYYHHPKYGRHKNYPFKLERLFTHNEEISVNSTRFRLFNWLNANCKGLWSIDEVKVAGPDKRTYELSFSERSDILIFKLVWGND